MATARKRPRPELEESQAECPFKVEHPNPHETQKKQKKRRRQDSEDRQAQQSPKLPLQVSPFSPTGKFKDPNNTMDRHYLVTPTQRWTDMTRYNSFVLNGVKYYSEGFIFVANNSTIERQRNPGETMQPRKKSDDDWVARILEIRASDEHHVYARVYWMYWPDELPPGTQDGKRLVEGGRQPYHGMNELIASNHMDIINVVSVTASATVNQWDETNEEEIQSALYWRQAIDVRTMELSSVELRCKCNRPENPDKTLIGCTNEACKKWLHDDCLVHDALLETYKRLGNDKPYKSVPIKEEAQEDVEGPKRPLSPSESGAAQTAQQSIDVKPEEQGTIKMSDVEKPLTETTIQAEDPSSIAVPSSSSEPKKRGRPRKSEGGDGDKSKPYEGLFEGIVRNDLSPTVVEIKDLRQNVVGGEKSWTQPVSCLICDHVIH